MRHCKFHILFVLFFVALTLMAESMRFGKWTVVNEEGAFPQLFYGERQIFSRVTCTQYLPAYDGIYTKFNFTKPVVSQNAVVWMQTDKEGEFRMVLTFEEQSARFQLTARLQNEGPLEYGFVMPLDSLRTLDGNLFVKADNKPCEIGDNAFKDINLSQFTCDLYAEQHQFVNNRCARNFVLQDNRKWDGKSIRLINSERPKVGETLTWDTSWNVTEFDAETATQLEKTLALAADDKPLVRKQSPASGATLADNTPYLTWHAIKDVYKYVVLLSQNASFPEAETLRCNAAGTSLQIEKPLASGVWYWKVVASGVVDSQPWSFQQTAALESDCTPPEVMDMGYRVLDKDDAIQICVREFSDERPQLKVLNGDEQVPVRLLRARGKKGEWYFCAVPEKGWPKGLSTLTFSATDNSGNNSTSQGWLLNSPKPENGVVINANGHYEENGKPIFPYGIYQVEKDEDMAELRSLGFNAVHTYFWENSRDDIACRSYLDRCWAANGLRAFIGFDRKAIVNGDFEVIAHRVGTIADHPGLFVYYLFDEPEDPAHYVTAPQMIKFANLIRGMDPYHAVVLTTWNPSMINYRATWDTHWSQAYSTPAYVVGLIDDHKRYLNNASPITLLLHCYDYDQMAEYRATGKYDVKAFKPDCEWMRCAAWAGICQGVNGLWWWWFCKNDPNWLTAPTVPEIWKGFCAMMRELCSYQEFLDSENMSFGRIPVEHQLVVWGVKKTADRELLIVANTGTEPVTVKLPVVTGHPQTLTLGRYGVSLQVLPSR